MDLNSKDKKYWASLVQYNNSPEFLEANAKEFISSPLTESEDSPLALDRRDFMKLMAASTALMSSACFQKPMHKILPYVNQPEEVTFGIANYYASTCGECASSCGTLVKTREGRPIKIEGNPDHPMNKGGLCSRGQASLLSLYDTDRVRAPQKANKGQGALKKMTWADVDKEVSLRLKSAKHVRILSENIHSPSTLKLTKEFLSSFPDGSHVTYEPLGAEAVVLGQEASYGTKVLPRFKFDKADVVVSIDADFLGTWISPVEFTKQFSAGKKLAKGQKKLTKLFSFDSMMTLTAANADVREGIRPTDGLSIALAIASELQSHGLSVDSANSEILKKYKSESKTVKEAAMALLKAQGKSLVVAGSPQSQTQDVVNLQIAVNLINSMLKNDGITVDHSVSPSQQSVSGSSSIMKLIKEMDENKVDTLIIYKSNPVYTLPKDAGFESALSKVANVIYIGVDANETAVLCDYILADNHSLESWNDAEPQKNLFSLQQPTIRPIYETRSYQDTLISLSKAAALNNKLKGTEDFHEYIQKNWEVSVYKAFNLKVGFDSFWESALRDGVFDGVSKSNSRNKTGTARSFKGSLKNISAVKTSDNSLQVAFYPQVAMYDGSQANNPWLQEVPDPVTRMTWDNYASVSPSTAKKMGVQDGDIVKIQFAKEILEIPAHVQPGLHNQVMAIAFGYGRTNAGKIGTGVGKNIFKFTQSSPSGIQMSGFSVSAAKTGEKYILASPQQHQSLEGRPIVKEANFHEWLENPSAGNEEHEKLTTLWEPHKYEGYRWGMAIDMNSCTGCNACVVSCQSENNIPVVGKDGVNRGRIMHWMRIDRYYTGTPDNPQVVHQPMLCQHCENAPCETVCPVIATLHDTEGLNSQIYNRCVGTRYCANNCPYKVRRFNWFEYNYAGQNRHPANLAQNPEVTVRSRGVMEKCSFCVQRIHDSRNNAKNLGRPIQDGEVKTACQQSCPADAIVFGNINDPSSEVSKMLKDPRGYHVLEELNVRPSITYLTKIRNTESI